MKKPHNLYMQTPAAIFWYTVGAYNHVCMCQRGTGAMHSIRTCLPLSTETVSTKQCQIWGREGWNKVSISETFTDKATSHSSRVWSVCYAGCVILFQANTKRNEGRKGRNFLTGTLGYTLLQRLSTYRHRHRHRHSHTHTQHQVCPMNKVRQVTKNKLKNTRLNVLHWITIKFELLYNIMKETEYFVSL